MNFEFLNGNESDVNLIRNNHEKIDMVYVLNNDTTKLYAYIDYLSSNGIGDDIMFNLKICHERTGLKLSFAHKGEKEQKITSISALIEKLDGKPCNVIVDDNSRITLAEVSQQLIYIGYPLTSLNIMLRKEAKDAEKTQRFMEKINEISEAIDSAVNGIDQLSSEWSGSEKLTDDQKQECIDLIAEARGRCQTIQEKVAKAKDVEMTVAVAASKKTGKSVIVNSMIGEEIAPTSLLLPTPNTCIYKKSEDDKYHLYLTGELDEYITITQKNSDFSSAKGIYDVLKKEFDASVAEHHSVGDMIIHYPANGTNFDNFTVFDTPGPDFAADDSHAQAAYEAMKKCDVAIFAIDYTKYLTDSEVAYLKKIKSNFNENQKFASLIFAINKLDQKYTDPTGSKSTIYAIDFIRHQLMSLGDMYKDCIVFATSALQYYDTIDCEKTIGSSFSQLDDLYDLKNVMKGQPANIRYELQFLQNMTSTYSNQMGLYKVSPADMKQYSGMPDLLSYAKYICNSKARDEIVNNITVTIDANTKALKAISQNIDAIDKLINAEEEQIQKIKGVIDEYTESVKGLLTDKVFLEELHANENPKADDAEFKSLGLLFKAINEDCISFDNIESFAQNKFNRRISRDSEVIKGIYDSIEQESYDDFIGKLEIASDENGRITGSTISSILNEVFSDELLVDCIKSYITGQIKETIEFFSPYIETLSDDITQIVNQRLEEIRQESDKCTTALEKLDTPLELPELPDFSFQIPEINDSLSLNSENITLKIDTQELMSLVKRENSDFVNFLRTILHPEWWGERLYYYEEELSFEKFQERLHHLYLEISQAIQKANAYETLCSENKAIADEFVRVISSIGTQFKAMLDLVGGSINRFSNLIDDTRKHKDNIDFHNAKKQLIKDIVDCSREFSNEWDSVLNELNDLKGGQS